jgi:hypothetical protein
LPYEVARAKFLSFDLDILRSEGFDGLGPPLPLAHFSHGVAVDVFPLVRCD